MAKFVSKASDNVFKIGKFLGVNENPDGDTGLKMGEAANMRNFKITDNGALQVRGGTKIVAGLLRAYNIVVSETAEVIATDLQTPKSTFTAYPEIGVDPGGTLFISGDPVTVTQANISSYVGHYWQNPSTGKIYKLGACTFEEAQGGNLKVAGGKVSVSADEVLLTNGVSVLTTYSSASVVNSKVVLSGDAHTGSGLSDGNGWGEENQPPERFDRAHVGRCWDNSPNPFGGVKRIAIITRWVNLGTGADIYGNEITYIADDKYIWRFYPVTAASNSSDKVVRGIWSGRVNGLEYIVAACNGYLWSLTETNGVWSKAQIGAITTTNPVHLFGFDKNLYILDGGDYKVWNGTSLTSVTGYRPLISVSNAPTGGGALLERVNKLNGLRRAQYSPDGTATTFQLPEKDLASVDFVKKTGDGTAVTFTADLVTGIVTITPALQVGVNSIEIGWTVKTSLRSQVEKMRFSETFNGETDTRVFIYGDGTNKAFYTGLDNNGKPTAEYFPDLNEIAVDSANSPITAMIKHYDSLLTFKTDGAFITTYGALTLADGTTTASFYTSPLNRDIGNKALGQAVLVNNNPLTLFGRSVYEWQLSSFAAKDERNAKPVSNKVGQTLSNVDLESAICFDDEFNTEYYVVQGDTAVVFNYTANAWYIYKNFPAVCMISYKQELYYGTADGYLRHLSRNYMNDAGEAIDAYWESGSMDFNAPHMGKYSKGIWVGIKPEANGEIKVTAITDKTNKLASKTSASGFFSFDDLDFETLSFNISSMPRVDAHKIKAKKFTYYKLIFSSVNTNTTATITNADISIRYTSNVR